MEDRLYYSGLSCIALMSQYACCNSVPNENVHSLVSQPHRLCSPTVQEVLKSTLLLLSGPACLRSKAILGQWLKSCLPLS